MVMMIQSHSIWSGGAARGRGTLCRALGYSVGQPMANAAVAGICLLGRRYGDSSSLMQLSRDFESLDNSFTPSLFLLYGL